MTPTLFVIDDSADIRYLMKIFLEAEGYKVTTAENGAVALDQLRAGLKPRLIFLDMIMPVMDGPSFLSALETELPEVFNSVPVVSTSALHESPSEKVRGFIRKPMDLNQLRTTVQRLIETSPCTDLLTS